ncbi:hypothetical protein QR680_017890 [Steinernema hermaphroditum]|uniref:Uncharacterized protein n=1 Tax=Steinernema hermaphroditum TaxID=289476 RepID=A0AA39HGX0_9BILA|nr:hypothetical protein QR680_017890 [Steinernema hermaphroditum]
MNSRCALLCTFLLFLCTLSESCVSMRQRFDGHRQIAALDILSTLYQNLTNAHDGAFAKNASKELRSQEKNCEDRQFEELFEQRVRICHSAYVLNHITTK